MKTKKKQIQKIGKDIDECFGELDSKELASSLNQGEEKAARITEIKTYLTSLKDLRTKMLSIGLKFVRKFERSCRYSTTTALVLFFLQTN